MIDVDIEFKERQRHLIYPQKVLQLIQPFNQIAFVVLAVYRILSVQEWMSA